MFLLVPGGSDLGQPTFFFMRSLTTPREHTLSVRDALTQLTTKKLGKMYVPSAFFVRIADDLSVGITHTTKFFGFEGTMLGHRLEETCNVIAIRWAEPATRLSHRMAHLSVYCKRFQDTKSLAKS